MFVDGGVRTGETTEPLVLGYDRDAARALAEKYGFEVIGLQLPRSCGQEFVHRIKI